MKRLFSLLLLASSTVSAAEDYVRHGFWGNIEIGPGSLHLAPEVANEQTRTKLYFSFAGGYTLHPQLQLGIEAGGWNIRTRSLWDSGEGEGLMQLFVVARYWPTPDSRLFLKAAAGNVTHWSTVTGANSGTGHGYTVGMGYELSRFSRMETWWFINYSAGKVTDYTPPDGVAQGEDYRAVTAGLSFGL